MAELNSCTSIRVAVSRKGRTERTRSRNVCNRKRAAKSETADYVQLFRWVKREYGGRAKHLCPAVFAETGRGLMTKVSLRPGDIVISIPKDALITTETVMVSTVGSHIKRCPHQFTAEQVLCMFLMYERHLGPLSSYEPYVNTIPKDFTTPAYFTEADLQTLPPSVQNQSEEIVKQMKNSFCETEQFCRKWWPEMLDVFTWAAFLWSWFAVNTRCVYLAEAASPQLKGCGNMALAPVLDLLNHSPWARVKAGLNSSGTGYEIVTFDSYRPYDQVFICYGDHSNSTLLLEYGFTIPHNPNNCYHFSKVELQTMVAAFNVSDLDRKDQLAREAGLQNVSVTEEGLSWKLQTYLRILAMTWEEMRDWAVVLGGERVSDDNERRMNAMAHWLLTSALQKNDPQLQKFSDVPTVNERMSLSLYQDNRHILHACIDQLKSDS